MSLEWSSLSDFLFFPKQEQQQQEVPGSFQCSVLSVKQNPRSSSFMFAGSRSSSIGRMSPYPIPNSPTKNCLIDQKSINPLMDTQQSPPPRIVGNKSHHHRWRLSQRIWELRKRFRPWSSNPKASPRGALSAIIAINLGLWSLYRAWWVRRLLKLRDVKGKKTPTTIIVWFFNFIFGVVAEKDFLILFCCRGHAHTRTHTHFVCCREKTSLFLFQRHYPLVCCRNFDCKECCVYCCGNCILEFGFCRFLRKERFFRELAEEKVGGVAEQIWEEEGGGGGEREEDRGFPLAKIEKAWRR